jgi:hypothetical protein
MSKKILLGAIIVLILLVIFFVVLNEKKSEQKIEDNIKDDNKSTDIEVKPTVVVGEGSLDDLLKRNENLECAISYQKNVNDDDVVEGSYFTSNGKMRGDFITKDSGQEILSSMIIKDNTFYSWSVIEGEKFGMKANFDQLAKSNTDDSKPKADNGPVPLDQTVKYDCRPWNNVDGSIFEPPTDVLFKDYNTIINTGMEYGNIYEDNGVDVNKIMKDVRDGQ